MIPTSKSKIKGYNRKIIAFQGFPKAKYAFYGKNCAILAAHIPKTGETAILPLECADGRILSIDSLQPDGKKPMDAKSFLNGYAKN
jgi:methionyl-tRNA formyltransferase